MKRALALLLAFAGATISLPAAPTWQVATFEADITIPVGHACMGGGIPDAKVIADPLLARGFVLRSEDSGLFKPVVVVALDWCQCNNDSYDRWREALALAASTTRERVMLATVHQHDAPICDLTAQKLLDAHGMKGANCDPAFHEKAVQSAATALRKALPHSRRVTHLGRGQTKVEKVASNRRVVSPQGQISWRRGSSSGNLYNAPEGEIDPWLKMLSLWDGNVPVLVWSSYAVHPMSHYGRGEVSADFPGIARARFQKEHPEIFPLYFTGCSGDTTAGKFNDGNPANRATLAARLYRGMSGAWANTKRVPLGAVSFRHATLHLPARDGGDFTEVQMKTILADPVESKWRRICAAMGLSWRARVAAGQAIDVPCLDFAGGDAQFMIMPAETFVGYQLIAQRLRPDSFVMVSGFGDGAPGYIPTDQCWIDGYADDYCWVAPKCQETMTDAMARALNSTQAKLDEPNSK